MSSRQRKSAALAKYRAAKQTGRSALDALDDMDDYDDNNNKNDSIYDVVTEEEYQHLVEARRQREDFVVDDDGLGYYDDGEEHLGDEDNDDRNSNKKRSAASGNAALTQTAIKKARRNAALTRHNKNSHGDDDDNDNDAAAAAAVVSKNKSMWEFVNKGTTVAVAPTNLTTDQVKSSNKKTAATSFFGARNSSSSSSSTIKPNVDDLLAQLDDPLASRSRKSLQSSSTSSSSSRRHRRRPVAPMRSRKSGISSTSRSTTGRRRHSSALQWQQDNDDDHDDDDDDNVPMLPPVQEQHDDDDDDDDDNVMMAFQDDDEAENVKEPPIIQHPSSSNTAAALSTSNKSVTFADDNDDVTKAESPSSSQDAGKKEDDTSSPNKNNEEINTQQPEAKKARRTFARPKLGQLSAAAQKAVQAEQQQQAQIKQLSSTATAAAAAAKITTAPNMDATFQPEVIASEAAGTAGPSQVSLEQVLTKPANDENQDAYLDFFWIDLCERNGDILLFGKTPYDNKYVSACVVVTGNVRNLFVLPRGDGSEMMQVHSEINTILHNKQILPRQAGTSWAGKVVQRAYAFEDGSIPRDKTDYLKVVYSSKYPVPEQELCQTGGEHFAKILGAGASVTENFIVKRKLMGPCWLRIRKPAASKAPVSWCKLECTVDSPKQVLRWDLAAAATAAAGGDENSTKTPAHQPQQQPPPPPPVVTMSLKLKTVVNPKTHKSEIVSLSAVCHKHVQLETASDESSKHMVQLSLIRPLDRNFPRDMDQHVAAHMPQLRKEPTERALLNRFLAQVGVWDPDVIVGHNAAGYDMEVLLQRCADLNVSTWSKLGRRKRQAAVPKHSRKEMAIADAMSGRLLCDTYLSAKELLRETTYSLTNLAATQLKTRRLEIEPVDIPQWFLSGKTVVQLALSTLFDAQLVQRLMFKLQVLPLTKQLTCIAGNLWSHTLKSNRAERTEYLLLHEFHRLKYLPPEKRRGKKNAAVAGGGGGNKAKYSGGLVLEPKKGLYDSFILLLDFNSLYPSIIQEFNLCFTTLDWSGYQDASATAQDDNDNSAMSSNLPPLPDASVEQGVLPRVIKSLVERRRAVKKILKNEKVPEKKEELDIRQKALKLTANSMYGCLGFSNSRFYAQPIAAMVTAMGRETLQRTVDIAQDKVGLDVIYGDTDSIMINTRLNSEQDLPQVIQLGEKVKKEVNRLYRTLELEIDGIFRSMLLLKKKKYAAKTVEQLPNGEIKYGEELKGLDLVRRDWCVQSKDTGRYVTGRILSGDDSETVLQDIHTHLEELATKMREGKLPIEKYVITKGLSKHPNDYPDAKSQPHVQVAKMMLKNNRPVNTGDHIPYVITAPIEDDSSNESSKALTVSERARHPEEVARSGGVLKPDVEWYLTQQILPPVSRLCEPIDGTSQQILAERLGLDASRYNHANQTISGVDEDITLDFTPTSSLPDAERFKDVEKLHLYCLACGQENAFPGVLHVVRDSVTGTPTVASGMHCPNPDCIRPQFWGGRNLMDVTSRLLCSIDIYSRGLMCRYYEGVIRCDEAGCGLETRQLSVAGGLCLRRGCNGRMYSVDTERDIHTHLKYLESIFSVEHACKQLEKQKTFGTEKDIERSVSIHDINASDQLHKKATSYLDKSAFNFISPNLWTCFEAGAKQ